MANFNTTNYIRFFQCFIREIGLYDLSLDSKFLDFLLFRKKIWTLGSSIAVVMFFFIFKHKGD
jgi:hypothetical protein